MVIKKDIQSTITKLDKEYNKALRSPNPQDATYFAKLAVLEFCGWIEESLDSIVKRSIKGKLKTNPFKQMFDTIVLNTYGFQYKDHFRPMLVKAVGIVRVEKLEQKLDSSGQIANLISELEALKSDRNHAAHTWIKGITTFYPAPSLIEGRLNNIYPILRIIYSEITKI